jgi:hypothetical protein
MKPSIYNNDMRFLLLNREEQDWLNAWFPVRYPKSLAIPINDRNMKMYQSISSKFNVTYERSDAGPMFIIYANESSALEESLITSLSDQIAAHIDKQVMSDIFNLYSNNNTNKIKP